MVEALQQYLLNNWGRFYGNKEHSLGTLYEVKHAPIASILLLLHNLGHTEVVTKIIFIV